ncbi:MAG: GDSL-type esterase/lipase family protein [Gemmatimonadota bacterium]|nr:GDSL-type esterase/lipase family protein [Gemmatimonadota bacterium]
MRTPSATGQPPLSPAKRRAFLAVTLLLPFACLGILEGALRLTWKAGDYALFQHTTVGQHDLLTPSPRVGRRYFPAEASPPAPPSDLFAVEKPPHGFRLFVLGASTAAGFPFPHNGTFSRVLRDALQDVLPEDSVEVVNVGIAATNSFTVADLTDEVLAQHPDAVLIYAGHNEYYGALGAASAIRLGSSRALTRAFLAAERLRTVVLLRNTLARATSWVRRGVPTDSTAASFMETVARDQQIPLGGAGYDDGLAQFHDNMSRTLQRYRSAGVPVFIASIASNERQRPFVSPGNGPARAAFDSAQASFATGDSLVARRQFTRARDLDVVRFRAPSALNDTIRSLATTTGAFYVPVAEAFIAGSPAGIPGPELFLEHVHPNQTGYALIARSFYEAIAQHGFLRRRARVSRLAPWSTYQDNMALSAFDEQIVHHIVRTITTRWPFVSAADAQDYRGSYRPTSVMDSLALAVSRGGVTWIEAKLRVGAAYESAHQPDSALAEYRGLLRDLPLAEPSWRLVGRALVASGRATEAAPYLEHAASLAENGESTYLLGVIALQNRNYDAAIALLDRAVTLQPGAAAPLYELSLAFGLSRNLGPAKAAAGRAARIDPRYPGLSQWLVTLAKASGDSIGRH